jgi:GNAT superfamily N-acetyltransferase
VIIARVPGVDISVCVTDEDYEAWREVRLAVVPDERCDTVAELREQDSTDRLMLLAAINGTVVGSGVAARSEMRGGGFVAPRVLAAYRRRGVGSSLLDSLAAHVASLGMPEMRAMVDDGGSLAFANHFGFIEVDRQIEQVRALGREPAPTALPEGIEVIFLDQQPQKWEECFASFGIEVLADFAVYEPLDITAEQWATSWAGNPMFLALSNDEVVGCAGLHRDTDHPERGENALTAVRRDWRGRGIASHLKRRTLRWAADNRLSEVYTWTQARNYSMLRLNEHLGYVNRKTTITTSRPLPL